MGLIACPSYSLRLSPEERKEILMKQMRRRQQEQQSTTGDVDGDNNNTSYTERDLLRECRRLNRYKGKGSWCSNGSFAQEFRQEAETVFWYPVLMDWNDTRRFRESASQAFVFSTCDHRFKTIQYTCTYSTINGTRSLRS